MAHLQIPDEGYKLVVIAGYYDGNPIWRTIGKVLVKNGKLYISVDRTFNPAGVVATTQNDASVLLNAVPYSPEGLQKKAEYKKTPPAGHKFPLRGKSNSFHDFDDDIPF